MLSLIGIPPLAGFFAKLYVFMEALNQTQAAQPVSLLWLVALGLFNSVVSAFYYVRVLKAMYFVQPGPTRLGPASAPIYYPIVLGTVPVIIFGVMPNWLASPMRETAIPMLTTGAVVPNRRESFAAAEQQRPPRPPAAATAQLKGGQGGGYPMPAQAKEYMLRKFGAAGAGKAASGKAAAKKKAPSPNPPEKTKGASSPTPAKPG
jgi:hypothetical protein